MIAFLLLALPVFSQDLSTFVAEAAPRFTAKPRRFQFGLIGDQEYTATQEGKFPRVIDAMNREKLRFVVHDGDVKSGQSPCTDSVFARRLAGFQRSIHPFILTPGDNDWTDCGRPDNGSYDAEERLKHVRTLFYPQPAKSLGQRNLSLSPQSAVTGFAPFVENALWAEGEVLFATLHLVGTNNNFAKPQEFQPRNAANLFWLRAAFGIAKQKRFRALMLITQANPGFDKKTRPAADGFGEFLKLLQAETLAFPGQVVLVHGDSHYFRIDKPLVRQGALIENFTRVETFGPPDVHWVRATVDPANPMVFVFEQRIVPENILPR